LRVRSTTTVDPVRRLLPLVLVVLASLAAAACEVHTEVAIDVTEDGSGAVEVRVELDREAVRRVGDPATAIRLDDLRAAGWDVPAPERAEGGSVTLVGRRAFSGPEQLSAVLEEVGGSEGVFRGVRVQVEDGFGSAQYELGATVHLTGSLEQFSDAELAAAVDGLPLARTPEELAAEGADDPRAATLTVSVALPGGAPRTTGSIEDGRATWTFPLSGGQATTEQIEVSSTTSSGRTGRLVILAAVAGGLALVALVVALVRRRS
jgi:hypothetical protein